MKYQGITKAVFKNMIRIGCAGHYNFAKRNNTLASQSQFANLELDPEGFMADYFDIIDNFESIDSMPDTFKFLLKMKTKVRDYFKSAIDLEGFNEDFQVSHEGLIATLDFVKINSEDKIIDVYMMTASTVSPVEAEDIITVGRDKDWWGSSLFSKTIKTEVANWIMTTFPEIPYNYFQEHKSRLYIVAPHTLFSKLWLPELISSAKKDQILGAQYNMAILANKYPGFKINLKIAYIKKTLAPFTFDFLEHNYDPNDNFGKDNREHWNDQLNKVLFLINVNHKYFDFPKWMTEFDDTAATCPICNSWKRDGKIYNNFNTSEVQRLLDRYPKKLAMIDFETINDPMPNTDFYYPYDKIVAQISTHLMEEGKETIHEEYIIKDLSKKELEVIYNMIEGYVKDGYRLVAYNRFFETACITTMERILDKKNNIRKLSFDKFVGKGEDIGEELYAYILDIWDFFKKQKKDVKAPISSKKFGWSSSLKRTIQLYCGEDNPYKELDIDNGFKAMKELYEIINDEQESGSDDKEKILANLYKYCKQDTLTMVDLYEKILELQKEYKDIGKEQE